MASLAGARRVGEAIPARVGAAAHRGAPRRLARALPMRRSGGAHPAPPAPAPAPRAAPPGGRRGAALAPRAQPAAGVGIFPAGGKQARVDLPALMVEADADAFERNSEALLADVNAAVTAGATAVVLGAGPGAGGAAALYEAAVALKALLRGRAALLLLDRTDIATAVDADGVVLSPSGAHPPLPLPPLAAARRRPCAPAHRAPSAPRPRAPRPAGVPVVVARRMLSGGAALVGQIASDAAGAAAAAADGANFILLRGSSGGLPDAPELEAARLGQRSGSAIPVIAAAEAGADPGPAVGLARAADGFGLPLGGLVAAAAAGGGSGGSIETAVGTLLQALTEARGGSAAASSAAPATKATVRVAAPGGAPSAGSTLRRLLGGGREGEVDAIIADERKLLQEVLVGWRVARRRLGYRSSLLL
jgi:hypothetical protein